MVYKYSQDGKKTIDPNNSIFLNKIQCYKKNGRNYIAQDMDDFKHHHQTIKKKLEDKGAENIEFMAHVLLPVGWRTFREYEFYSGKIEDYYEGEVKEAPQMTNEIFQIQFSVKYSL